MTWAMTKFFFLVDRYYSGIRDSEIEGYKHSLEIRFRVVKYV